MRLSHGLMFVTLLGCGPKRAPEQPAALPTAEDIFAREVEAMGGEALLRETRTLHVLARLEMPAQGMNGTVEIWTGPPGQKSVVTLAGLGTMLQGFDRERDLGWASDAMLGPRILQGGELDVVRKAADTQSGLNRETYYSSWEVKERSSYNDQDAYGISMTTHSGQTELHWYSVETGLPLGMESEVSTPMGSVPLKVTIEDYREVDGILMAFRTTNAVGPMQQVMTIETVNRNIELPEFALPEEIIALLPADGPTTPEVPEQGPEPTESGE